MGMEEEEKERKRAERKAREKEANYRERLRAWETREAKKGKEYEKERLKERKKVEEVEGYTDEDMKNEDNLAGERIGQILNDHSKEIESYVPKEPVGLPVAREAPPTATLQRMGTRDEGLDDVEE